MYMEKNEYLCSPIESPSRQGEVCTDVHRLAEKTLITITINKKQCTQL